MMLFRLLMVLVCIAVLTITVSAQAHGGRQRQVQKQVIVERQIVQRQRVAPVRLRQRIVVDQQHYAQSYVYAAPLVQQQIVQTYVQPVYIQPLVQQQVVVPYAAPSCLAQPLRLRSSIGGCQSFFSY